jgi:CheY-like chemotaxis protein
MRGFGMSDAVIIMGSLLVFLLLIFLVLVIRFPEVFRGIRIAGVSAGPEGVSLMFAERAVAEKERDRKPDRRTLRQRLARLPLQGRILWVDDDPDNNLNEVMALKEHGLDVTAATTNKQAAECLKRDAFALVISDIGRPAPEPKEAGLELPEELAKVSDAVPPIIYYVGDVTEDLVRGQYPVTDRPSELFGLIAEHIQAAPATS